MNPKRNIVLIGLMGAGKTTAAKILGEWLNCDWVDLDNLIQDQTGNDVVSLFSNGEDYFRKLESQVLSGVLLRSHQVVSTGGGVVVLPENRQILQEEKDRGSVIIWLKASVGTLIDRLADTKEMDTRPLLSGSDPVTALKNLETKRKVYYQQLANFSVDTDQLSPETVARKIQQILEERGFLSENPVS